MNKFEKLRAISNEAAKQASANCAARVAKLTENQLSTVMDELKRNCADKSEVSRLEREIQSATDKNAALQNFVHKSQAVCQSVADIIGQIL